MFTRCGLSDSSAATRAQSGSAAGCNAACHWEAHRSGLHLGWVAAGSPRISYVGLQIAFAIYLAIFQGFAPGTGLDVIRDRIAGIVLGIIVTTVVFTYLWPEGEKPA